jgi:hypothetical protein
VDRSARLIVEMVDLEGVIPGKRTHLPQGSLHFGRQVSVELNLCPSCSAFINASWDACVACGAQLRVPREASVADTPVDDVVEAPAVQPAPAIEYTPEPQATPLLAPASVVGNDVEGFTVQWSAPDDSANLEPVAEPPAANTWSAPAPSAVSTAGGWALPDHTPVQQTAVRPPVDLQPVDVEPVQISWPAPKSSADAKPAAPVNDVVTPSFYAEPANSQLPPPVEPQTFQYDTTTFSSGLPNLRDGRLAPAVGKKAIIALAVAGPIGLIVLLIAIVSFIGTSSNTTSSDNNAASAGILATDAAKAASHGWVSYTDPDGRFSASLPTQPVVQNGSGKDGASATWTSSTADGHIAVVIGAVTLPAGDYKNNQQVLTDALNGASANSGMDIKGQITDTDGSVLHLDAFLAKDQVSSNVRLFVSNNVLYVISLTTDKQDGDPQAFDTLTKSFQVLNGKKPA